MLNAKPSVLGAIIGKARTDTAGLAGLSVSFSVLLYFAVCTLTLIIEASLFAKNTPKPT